MANATTWLLWRVFGLTCSWVTAAPGYAGS